MAGTEFDNDEYSENCQVINPSETLGICLRTDRKYDVVGCCCTFTVLAIREVPLDRYDPPDPEGKARAWGISPWELLAYFGYDASSRCFNFVKYGEEGMSRNDYYDCDRKIKEYEETKNYNNL